jgi:hypothetical protein
MTEPEQRPDQAAAEPSPSTESTGAPPDQPEPPHVDPQLLFGGLSLDAIEADIDAMMADKMSRLDGMLSGLEELVVRLEGELTALETPPEDNP